MFLAAIGHDVGHPSTNNAYSIRTSDSLSILYNDKSVLENHHISLFFQILRQEKANVFLNFNKEEFDYCWSFIIDSILKTDMAYHMQICEDFWKKTIKFEKEDKVFDFKNKELKANLASVLIHAADIGSAGLGFD